MDGGSAIVDPDGHFLIDPIHSNQDNSVKAAQNGCVHAFEPGYPELSHCEFFPVDGYDQDQEFLVVTGEASLGAVLAAKTFQDNLGNYARSDIWKVTWNNAPRGYLEATTPYEGYNGLPAEVVAPVEDPQDLTIQEAQAPPPESQNP